MSAVQYVCPRPGCGKKGFDEPGGTKMVCRIHQERMVQHEAGPEEVIAGAVNEKGQGVIGNDFRFRKAQLTPDGTNFKPAPNDKPVNEPAAVERTRLNQQYRDLTGQVASRAWSMEQLRRNVDFAEKQAAGKNSGPPSKKQPRNVLKKEQPA